MKTYFLSIAGACLFLAVWKLCCLAAPVPKPPPPKERATLKGHTDCVKSIAFSPDGKLLASGSWDKTIKLWDVATGKNTATLSGHTARVEAVAFSPDGKMLASTGQDWVLRLWEVPSGKALATLPKRWAYSDRLTFSRDGKTVFNGLFWDIPARKPREDIKESFPKGHRVNLQSSPYDSDGKLLGVVWSKTSRTGEIWDALTNKALRTLKVPEEGVFGQCAAFSPDCKVFASAAERLFLWDVQTGKLIGNYKRPGDLTTALAFSPDGKLLATAWRRIPREAGPYPGIISILDPDTGKELAILEGYKYAIGSLAFSPHGNLLASDSGGDNLIKLWDVRGVSAPKKD